MVGLLNTVEGWIREQQAAPRICHTLKKQALPISVPTDGWASSPATVNETRHKAEVPRFPEKHTVNYFGHPKPFWIPLQKKTACYTFLLALVWIFHALLNSLWPHHHPDSKDTQKDTQLSQISKAKRGSLQWEKKWAAGSSAPPTLSWIFELNLYAESYLSW